MKGSIKLDEVIKILKEESQETKPIKNEKGNKIIGFETTEAFKIAERYLLEFGKLSDFITCAEYCAYYNIIELADTIAQKIIESKDPKSCYLLATIENFRTLKNYTAKIQQIILDSKDYDLIFNFAKNYVYADIKKCAKAIIESNLANVNYKFAKEFGRKCDITAHQKIVLDSKYPQLCLNFAKFVKGADIKALEKVCLECKDAELCLDFVQNVKDADIKAHQQVIINEENSKLAYKFSLITGADVNALANVAIKNKNAKVCFNFAKQFADKVDLKAIEEIIIESKDSDLCYNFAIDIPGVNIKALEKVIIEGNDPLMCYRFASKFKDADIKALEEVVLNNPGRINLLFARDIKGADIKAHHKALVKCGNKDLIDDFNNFFPKYANEKNNNIILEKMQREINQHNDKEMLM